jgi:hypothetical protein
MCADEVASLMPLGRPFDNLSSTAQVSPTCLIHLNAPLQCACLFRQPAGEPQGLPERIVIAAEGILWTRHHRGHHLPGRTIYNWRHYLAVIRESLVPCATGRPLPTADAFRQLQGHILKRPGGDREMARSSLVLQHDEQVVLCAVEWHWMRRHRTHVLNFCTG